MAVKQAVTIESTTRRTLCRRDATCLEDDNDDDVMGGGGRWSPVAVANDRC